MITVIKGAAVVLVILLAFALVGNEDLKEEKRQADVQKAFNEGYRVGVHSGGREAARVKCAPMSRGF